MDQKQVLALARQGNPQAIAALMNHRLQAKGSAAKITEKDNTLQIVLESSQVPHQQDSVVFVVEGLTNLGFSKAAKIYGRQIGEDLPAWVQEIDFSQLQTNNQSQAEETVHCPRCQSIQVLASKQGFGLGKAAVGAILLGPIGLAGGFLGSNQVFLSCLKCGHQWKIGQVSSVMAANAKPTKAQVSRLKLGERLICGVVVAIFVGLIGALFLGYAAWGAAVFIVLAFLFGVDEFVTSLKGKCPYCDKDIATSLEKKNFTCIHCKGRINATRLSPQEYEFNPTPNP